MINFSLFSEQISLILRA